MTRGSGTREATEQRFAERAAQARGQRLRRWLVVMLCIAVVLGLGWLFGFSALLGTKRVEVTGADPADRPRIEAIAETEIGTPLARVDADALSSTITDDVAGAAHADVERGWPHTLKVNVTSRVPALAVRRDGGYRLLDLEGVEIRTVSSPPKGVPAVTAEGQEGVSGHGVRAAQGMLAALPQALRSRVKDVTVDSADQITFRLGGTEVVWGDGSDPELKVKVIPILLQKKPDVIDVSAPETPVTRG
ncbi:cell division protein FtsQ/DivIB [Janibacter terrae]|jgi:cell division protein FtsQ|uniref:Cell division protein FtsQ/DivIB n=1 Tax=Janibacter terrae TaxID=103817 RepID=A0ABZ2FFM8_9MICO|nr:cell division protein FtsQ/DivIB [Janibacter terrae]MBA4085731.1 cell division protein FtsQ [Kytococcus sp.]HBO55002.1 cell division protein FtsQ [Janibacter terrae]HCA85927.1 cell division protein FtsQ [Streptomyces sp.]